MSLKKRCFGTGRVVLQINTLKLLLPRATMCERRTLKEICERVRYGPVPVRNSCESILADNRDFCGPRRGERQIFRGHRQY